MTARVARVGTSAALALLLGGCVAMAALPVLAGGAMLAGGNARIRAATPRPAAQARVAKPLERPEMTAGTGIALAAPPALLEPAAEPAASVADPWQRFFAYALDRAARAADEGGERSALLEAGTSIDLPRMRACDGTAPAVILDLDVGTGPFVGDAVALAPAALVKGLAGLREAGVVVAWISATPASEVARVAEALEASGLDPEGEDPLLLIRSPRDRKQLLRAQANADVCVIAIAGDRRADFDELFDYLRDPARGAALDFLLGAGWFLVPPPLDRP